jgi:uncharacterized membrane protein YesL
MKRKSISRWWAILSDELGWLWVNNLLYLLCIAPSVICGILFISFQAYLFLVLAVAAFVIAGPAILAIHKTTLDAAAEESRMVRIRFFAVYRLNFRKGIILGLLLAVALLLIGMPVNFALSINSPVLGLIVFACCVSLLLWHSSASQILSGLCSNGKFDLEKLLGEIFGPGFMSVVFGLTKLVWLFLCLFAPIFASSCVLVGVPTLIRFTILYYLYNPGDVNE